MNTRYLRKRGKGWAVVVTVPKRLQKKAASHFGSTSGIKKEIVRGLGTRDLAEANRLKLEAIGQINSALAALDKNEAPDPIKLSREVNPNDDNDLDVISDMADTIRFHTGLEEAKRFYDIATRKAVPISIASGQWLSEASEGLTEHTRKAYKAAVDEFIAWSNDTTVNAVTQKTAGEYVSLLKTTPSLKTGKPPAPNTLNRKVRTLGALWKWLAARGIIEMTQSHIWEHQLGATPGDKKGRAKPVKQLRALTRDEAIRWLQYVQGSKVKYNNAMADMIILAWHTGVRAEDLCSLTVDQVRYDPENSVVWLMITGGKTKANTRSIPVLSPEAINILNQRVKAAQENTLFYEIPPEKASGKRYARLQRKINPLRKKALGNIPVDFHSFRRAFSNACEAASLDPVQWSRMMGHEAPTLASAVYNKGYQSEKLALEAIRRIENELGELTTATN